MSCGKLFMPKNIWNGTVAFINRSVRNAGNGLGKSMKRSFEYFPESQKNQVLQVT